MDGSIAPAMALTPKKAEQQIAGLEWPLNLHLVKLLGFDVPGETRSVWKREVRGWLGQVATLRIKPASRTPPAATLMDWLHDERFEGSEVQNVSSMLSLLSDEYPRNALPPEAVAQRLRSFHLAASAELSLGRVPLDLVEAL